VEECGISDTIDGCRPPGRKENKAHVSRGMRKTCFTRPSHLIVGIRKPKDAPIAVTPGVRLGALMNRTERMDKNLFATLERVMVRPNDRLQMRRWSFFGVREQRDTFKPQFAFQK
jgi:hypothetical protein